MIIDLHENELDMILYALADCSRDLRTDARNETNEVDAEDMRMSADLNDDLAVKIQCQMGRSA